jgi:4-hydroxyproline epimerase
MPGRADARIALMQRMHVIDSHTAGEPTRLVLEGGPDLGDGSLAQRAQRFHTDFDAYRSAIVNEPRGSDPLVGALLVKPHHPDCTLGVIFFNNVGFLGMCGHGTIGLIASLQHTGELKVGAVNIDTPVGPIKARLDADGSISVVNVVSYRSAHQQAVEVPGIGRVVGDVAWGGNWFFLVSEHNQIIDLAHIEALTAYAWRIREAVNAQGFPLVDHVELFGSATTPGAHSRNFVLCPGKAYDRSPCGTGTSAKLACLAADGKLAEGETWVQESVIGSRMSGSFRWQDRARGEIVPTITGTAHVTGEATLYLDPRDPFCWGIRV